jgi:hypothetical protein
MDAEEKEGQRGSEQCRFALGEEGWDGQSEISDLSEEEGDSEHCQQGEVEAPEREREQAEVNGCIYTCRSNQVASQLGVESEAEGTEGN